MTTSRIISWNVNGLRSVLKKGFVEWLEGSGAAIVSLQEVRARADQLEDELARLSGWECQIASAERPGYSGTAILSRAAPDRVELGLGDPRLDGEGRLVLAFFGRLLVVSAYFPNGNGKLRDNSRVPFKLAFSRALFDRLDRYRRGGYRVLVMGDFNTAHREVDLARPKSNRKTSGFLPEEREELDRWLRRGWTDTFRRFEPGAGHYTWWSQRFGVRARNVGWRIDYVLASRVAMKHVESAFHLPEVMGSDHCPIGVDVSRSISG